MNILVVYYSESGNTRKVAEAIAGSLTAAPDAMVDLRSVEEISSARWENYDLIFIGTPAIRHTVADPIKEAFESFPDEVRPLFKLSLFVTYGVPDIQFYNGCIEFVKACCAQRNMEYLGEFCCLGEHRFIDRLAQKFPEKVEPAKKSVGHPDKDDLQRAADFAVDMYGRALDEG